MSALSDVTSAVIAALKAAPGLASLNRVGTGEGERSPVPYAWIGEAAAGEWGAKLPEGHELTFSISIADRGDPARLAALVEEAEEALRALPRPIGRWDHAGPRLRRTRQIQRRDGTRIASIDMRLRVLALP
jgi:hypothetical protein